MKISQSNTRTEFPLLDKKITKKTISSTLFYALILLIVGVFAIIGVTSDSQSGGVVISWITNSSVIILAVLFGLTYIYQSWYFAVYYYELTPDYIQIKKGPITPTEITIPYERIQDVYIDQDLLDRFFGLYDVHVSSATASSGMEAHIDGVSKASAEALRTKLLQTVKEKISRNHS